ncbi:type II toxin-antitoxin system Phd/YefM family antitoxin [Vibrio parahaemolyticus]|nr:type II toxin-antitoxin system Phd/YefM family antitoxin [Vibrio parahaemolyticus]
MRTETVSFLKSKAANLPLDEPLTITQNGKPVYIVESYEEYHRRAQSVALMKLVSFGQKDMQDGRVVSSEQFRQNLRARKAV